jgi:hypothetical protein
MYTCHICGLQTKQLNGLMSRHWKKHCNKSYTKEQYKIDVLSYNGRAQKICSICGKPTKIAKGESQYPKYHKKCYFKTLKGKGNPNYQNKKITKKCTECGSEVTKFESLFHSKKGLYFCSTSCSRKYYSKQKEYINSHYPLPNGKTLNSFCNENGIKNCFKIKKIYNKYGPEKALTFISDYKQKDNTDIEKIIINQLKFKKYNKTVNKIKNKKYRPDFKINKDCFLEADGLFWHSERRKKEKDYHLIKRKDFEKHNLRLFQFRADEIENKLEIISSILNNYLNKNTIKIYARKTILNKVSYDESNVFFKKNHLMDKGAPSKCLGLYSDNELIMCISYKKYKNGIDISRLATKCGYIVVGGLSKLLKHIEKTEKPEFIQSFVDLRYATGYSLEKLGFKRESVTLGWKWTDGFNTYNRLHCRANMDSRGLTEAEHAKEMKLFKIYDAGQAKYILFF